MQENAHRAPRELMNTAEVAEYLRLGERTVYELVRNRRIPCSRVAGKWLFPRRLIDEWVSRSADYQGEAPLRPPPVIAGSHDPLLEWAMRESSCELALLSCGSEDGLRRLVAGQALVAAMHVLDGETGEYNVPRLKALGPLGDLVAIEWAWREQGLIVAAGNPLAIERLADLREKKARVAQRQEGAGARILLEHLLAREGMATADLAVVPTAARTETDLAAMVLDGKADCGLGIRAVASRFRLDFVPLARERFDLVMRRRDYFEPPMQALLAFARGAAFAQHAAELGGYDVGGTGNVRYNA
jgi:excisionase family DNA binding protein